LSGVQIHYQNQKLSAFSSSSHLKRVTETGKTLPNRFNSYSMSTLPRPEVSMSMRSTQRILACALSALALSASVQANPVSVIPKPPELNPAVVLQAQPAPVVPAATIVETIVPPAPVELAPETIEIMPPVPVQSVPLPAVEVVNPILEPEPFALALAVEPVLAAAAPAPISPPVVNVNPVPAPPAIVLLGIGAVGLLGRRFRKRAVEAEVTA
jgi:hypothetical protein